ncbi:MAG TPA: DNA-binding response regulator [Planctomycetaceae bacterium]|nr:DNA-binding response regulator [Planctomycetaceae bacterium]
MKNQSVLVVEDEDDIRELVGYNLFKDGFRVTGVRTGEDGLRAIANERPDLVLLDLMLPGVDGLSLCKKLKSDAKTRDIPVIMLTAKGEESDIVKGLNMGADDYVTKPFSPKVLMARVAAVLRRAADEASKPDAGSEEPMTFGRLSIHLGRHEVLVDDEPVDLTSTEFRVLTFLARKPGWVFTRHQILDGVHGDKYAITDRAVDVQIVGLRKKLGSAGEYIETVRGVGYRFKE